MRTDLPCPAAVLENIKPEFHDAFKQAFVSVGPRTHNGCWILADDATVYIILENGGSVSAPVSMFKPVETI
jgi:hypothetical protein